MLELQRLLVCKPWVLWEEWKSSLSQVWLNNVLFESTIVLSCSPNWGKCKSLSFFSFWMFWKPYLIWHFQICFEKGNNYNLTHRILQTPCWSASRSLLCAAGSSPGCPAQREDSCTAGKPRCTHTSSHCSGKQTDPQIYSQCSWVPPGWSSSEGSLVGWPAALWWTRNGREGEKCIILISEICQNVKQVKSSHIWHIKER